METEDTGVGCAISDMFSDSKGHVSVAKISEANLIFRHGRMKEFILV
jgi:hypothetical protein